MITIRAETSEDFPAVRRVNELAFEGPTEAALVDALRSGELAGAGLDVYEHEPELAPGLAELDNVVLAPHTASATFEARTAMSRLAAENVIAALEGRPLPTEVVQPE